METASRVFVFEVAYFRRNEPVLVRIRDQSYAAAERRVKQMHPLSRITYLGDEQQASMPPQLVTGSPAHQHLY